MKNSENPTHSFKMQQAFTNNDATHFLIDRACENTKPARDFLLRLCNEIVSIKNHDTSMAVNALLIARVSGDEGLRHNLEVLAAEFQQNREDKRAPFLTQLMIETTLQCAENEAPQASEDSSVAGRPKLS